LLARKIAGERKGGNGKIVCKSGRDGRGGHTPGRKETNGRGRRVRVGNRKGKKGEGG